MTEATTRFREIVGRRLGLGFDETRDAFLEGVIRRRLEATGDAIEPWLAAVDGAPQGAEELRALARELTVGETLFFRHADQLRAFVEVAAARPGPLRVLSAACGSGEEPSTLAMLLREDPRLAGREVRVHGIDLNPAALERARRGRYSAWSLRETTPERRARWFTADGAEFVLDPSVRAAITYEERNLVDPDPALWARGAWDVVFCRNVLMYFGAEAQRAVVERIGGALAAGGHLFLGHAENLRGLSHDFHLRHAHGAFYYERRDGARPAPTPRPAPPAPLPPDGSWSEAIARSSERIRALSARPAPRAPVARRADLGLVAELLGQERHAEARELLGALPPDRARDPDALLLRAVLLTHGGDLAEAERLGTELLAIDDLSAGAHYLVALCREGAGDPRAAIEHDEVAVHLDPGFAMPRLHLGLLARRAGDRDTARRELGRALVLLEREEPARVLLFGGGFGREALLALCRAELVACGGAP